MPVERLPPDAIVSQNQLNGSLSAIQDDPDSPDANWLTATASTANPTLRVSFPTPSALPSGSATQEIRVLIRRSGTSGNGTPSWFLELRPTGSVSTLRRVVGRLSTDQAVVTITWTLDSFTGLLNADGSNVELFIGGTTHGGGPNTRTVEIGAVEWNAQTEEAGGGTIEAGPWGVGPLGTAPWGSTLTEEAAAAAAEGQGSAGGSSTAAANSESVSSGQGDPSTAGRLFGDTGASTSTGAGAASGQGTASGVRANTSAGEGSAAGTSTATAQSVAAIVSAGQEAIRKMHEGPSW